MNSWRNRMTEESFRRSWIRQTVRFLRSNLIQAKKRTWSELNYVSRARTRHNAAILNGGPSGMKLGDRRPKRSFARWASGRQAPYGPPYKTNAIDGHSTTRVDGFITMTPASPGAQSPDRNLLFGVLALQLEIIDDRQFAQAAAAWATRKDQPLADVLKDLGWLTANDRREVERLIERKLKKHGDARQSLAA